MSQVNKILLIVFLLIGFTLGYFWPKTNLYAQSTVNVPYVPAMCTDGKGGAWLLYGSAVLHLTSDGKLVQTSVFPVLHD